MPETSYAFLTLRRTAVELITFPDREAAAEPLIVTSGEGERVATRHLGEWLSRRFDSEIMPLLRDQRLLAAKVADLTPELARVEAAAGDWLTQARVEEQPGDRHEVRISFPGEPPIPCRPMMERPYEWTVVLTRADQTVVRLPPSLGVIRTTGMHPPPVATLLERAVEIVRWLNPYRSRAERLRAELEFLRPLADGRGTTASPAADVDALFGAWAGTQATMRPVIEPAEGWELRTTAADGRLFRAGPAGEWPDDQVLEELNKLARQGWRVVSVSEDKRVAGERNEPTSTRYLLERTT